jgi:hypothetical protein
MKKADILIALGVLTPLLTGRKERGSFSRVSKDYIKELSEYTADLYSDSGVYPSLEELRKYFITGSQYHYDDPSLFFCSKKWITFTNWSKVMSNATPSDAPFKGFDLKLWKKTIKGMKGLKFKVSRDGNSRPSGFTERGWSCWIRSKKISDLDEIITTVNPDKVILYNDVRYALYETFDGPWYRSGKGTLHESINTGQFRQKLKSKKKDRWWSYTSGGIFGSDQVGQYGSKKDTTHVDNKICFQFQTEIPNAVKKPLPKPGHTYGPDEVIITEYRTVPKQYTWNHKPYAFTDDGKMKLGYCYANLQWQDFPPGNEDAKKAWMQGF